MQFNNLAGCAAACLSSWPACLDTAIQAAAALVTEAGAVPTCRARGAREAALYRSSHMPRCMAMRRLDSAGKTRHCRPRAIGSSSKKSPAHARHVTEAGQVCGSAFGGALQVAAPQHVVTLPHKAAGDLLIHGTEDLVGSCERSSTQY